MDGQLDALSAGGAIEIMRLGYDFFPAQALPLLACLCAALLKIKIRDLDSDCPVTPHQNVGLVPVGDDTTGQLVGFAEALEIVALYFAICFSCCGRVHGASLEIVLLTLTERNL